MLILFSEISNAGVEGITLVLEKVKPVQLKLKQWFANLPECLSMDNIHVMKLNSVGYLRLAYIATEITLHRRILLSLTPFTEPRLLQICRSVAHERFIFAVDFVQSMKPQHLSSFWYFASPQNFALVGMFGTLLLSTASTSEEAESHRSKLKEYRWTLKMNSENGAKYMKPAMTLLDANLGLLSQATNAVRSDSDPTSPHTGRITSNTGQFAYLQQGVASPGQYSFGTPYFTGHSSMIDTPVPYSSAISDSQSQDFAYDTEENANLWSY